MFAFEVKDNFKKLTQDRGKFVVINLSAELHVEVKQLYTTSNLHKKHSRDSQTMFYHRGVLLWSLFSYQ